MNSTKHKDTFLKLALVACIAIATLCLLPRLVGLLGDSSAVANVPDRLSLVDLPAQPKLVTKSIEEIRCGDRIPSELPLGLMPEDEPEPDQATWRLVELEVAKKDGSKVEVKLLRPLEWLQQAGAIRKGTFSISVEELDVEGEAAVLNVLPCPRIEPGEGQVVTGTFRHTCDSLVELQVEGEAEQIVCTSGHPIWSETHNSFVPASRLTKNETLILLGSRYSKVSSQVPSRARNAQRVYNIEVAGSHVYHVGNTGILVHNAVESCKVALGLDEELDDFASTHKAKKILSLANDPDRAGDAVNWKPTFFEVVADPNNEVVFNLDKVNVWEGVTRAASGRGGATDWELLQIRNNPDWWSRILWFKGGEEAPNPFED